LDLFFVVVVVVLSNLFQLLEEVVDLLSNFGSFVQSHTSIRELVDDQDGGPAGDTSSLQRKQPDTNDLEQPKNRIGSLE
jgi:hypothetical protein